MIGCHNFPMDATEARTHHMRRLVAEAGGPARWVRAYGGDRWGQPQVSSWISRNKAVRKDIGRKLARDLEDAQGLKRGSLDLPPEMSTPVARSDTRPGYVRFPLLEGYAGMGRGDYIGDYPEITDWIEVTREWASQKLRGVPLESIRIITGRGQSMRGVYNDGDLVFVDSRIKSFLGDSAYCFRWAGEVHIKRLQKRSVDTVRILSAHPDYENIDVPLDEIEIGGRALAAWTLVEF